MGELGALFNPGMRHEIEERQSKASRREEEGQSDPGNLRIDLLSGVAVIKMGTAATSDPEDSDMNDSANDPAESETDAPAEPETDEAAESETDEAAESETDEAAVESADAGQPLADTGSAPRHPSGTSVDADGEIDDAALRIARGSMNSEPPA